MAKTTVKMPSFQSVTKGGTASCHLPIGSTYDQIIMTTNIPLNKMYEIRLIGNGRIIQRYPTANGKSGGEVLDMINQYEGRSASAGGILVMDFERFGMRTRVNTELSSIGTGYSPANPDYKAMGGLGIELSTLTLEIVIDASMAASPVLSASAVQSPARPLGLFKKIFTYLHNPQGEQFYEVSTITTGDLVNKIYALSDKVASLDLQVDRSTIFKRTKLENDLIQNDGVRKSQAAMFVYDPSESGNGSDALPTRGVQDFRQTFEMTEGGELPLVVEYLGQLTN
jgi:hypothetical protein